MQTKTIFSLLAMAVASVSAQDAPWCESFNSAITDNDGHMTGKSMWSVVIPQDGSATESGYDAANNCGGGFKDNLNGRGAIITDWHCSYGPDNSACVHFTATTWGSDDVGAAYDAATGGLQLPCDFKGLQDQNAYIRCPFE